MKHFFSFLLLLIGSTGTAQNSMHPIWSRVQLDFKSDKTYENALYDVKNFQATFTSPTGRTWILNGFWDGGTDWKIRFCPDEIGVWQWESHCSDASNQGLNGQKGQLTITENDSDLAIYQHGMVQTRKGDYHLRHADGTPFFWTGCTAWNGALKSSKEDWDYYLDHRKRNDYNLIQFVATQWRGGAKNKEGEVAFTGSGKIEINPAFFKRMDERCQQINQHGLVAAPVLLWALPSITGRYLSPGYYLPKEEAVLLAKYIVARWQGNHVVWILGGDGKYLDDNAQRWKYIGREVFKNRTQAPVTLHPSGQQWIGAAFADQDWHTVVTYQTSHSNRQKVVDWLNKGPIVDSWHLLPPRPIINAEPNYEEIHFKITAEDVRNASYWSIFAAPVGGVTYGANGIWPWIEKEGQMVENHFSGATKGPSTWRKSIAFPGSIQIGLLSKFMQQFEWWTLRPAGELLLDQPGDEAYNHFVSVVADDRKNLILAYVPKASVFQLRLPHKANYTIQWFDPITGNTKEGTAKKLNNGVWEFSPIPGQDWVLVCRLTTE